MINDLGIVIAAAGSGTRFGGNKLLMPLHGKPLFIYCLEQFITCCPQQHLLLTIPAAQQQDFAAQLEYFLPGRDIRLIIGGNSRAQSVLNGLQALPQGIRFVAIHDAARPFADSKLLLRCLDTARQVGAAIPGKRLTDSLKAVDGNRKITSALNRDNLWLAETPQLFALPRLLKAYSKLAAEHHLAQYTDEAAIFTAAGGEVMMVENPAMNIKVTYPEDFALAARFAAETGNKEDS